MVRQRKSDNKEKNNKPVVVEKETKVATSPIVKKKEIKYEFGGPIGALGVVIGLPIVIFGLYAICNEEACLDFSFTFPWAAWGAKWSAVLGITGAVSRVFPAILDHASQIETIGNATVNPLDIPVAFTKLGITVFVLWMAFQVLLERILPGETAYGAVLPRAPGAPANAPAVRLPYVLSGHLQFWVVFATLLFGWPTYKWVTDANGVENILTVTGLGRLPLELLYDYYLPLLTASILFSVVLSVYLYTSSFFPANKILAAGGDTGSMIYDFFIGRELNPRIGSLDLKEFCELRPGLVAWAVLNLGMAFKQYQKHGHVTLSMFFVTALQGFYVWDAQYNEKSILTTMDITTDGFGFMLAFGDLAWVPFIYSLQARYLVDYDPNLSFPVILAILALYSFGFWIFRSANGEKDAFRQNPDSPEVAHLSFLKTKRGTKLLTSGWWGTARKINYTGDWLMTLSWCLFCGFNSPVPYFQAIYFMILLIHRAIRDDEICHEKYGDDWLEYKRRVPYMFIPYVI